MSKYSPLAEYLALNPSDEVRLSFADIEEIIGDTLPPSAHSFREWWANQRAHPSHRWATEWMEAGWECATVSLQERWVTFKRVG